MSNEFHLFNTYISDLKEEMRKKQTDGMIIKKKKVRLSAYADIVLLARSEQEIERGYEEI